MSKLLVEKSILPVSLAEAEGAFLLLDVLLLDVLLLDVLLLDVLLLDVLLSEVLDAPGLLFELLWEELDSRLEEDDEELELRLELELELELLVEPTPMGQPHDR